MVFQFPETDGVSDRFACNLVEGGYNLKMCCTQSRSGRRWSHETYKLPRQPVIVTPREPPLSLLNDAYYKTQTNIRTQCD